MRTLVVVILALCAAACSSDPIVDMKGVDEERYEQDLAECRQYADQVDVARSAGGGALLGAAGGAAVGAVVGAITGRPGTGAAVGAVVGAITGRPGTGAAVGGGAGGTSGLFAGGASGANKKERIVRNCLRGRGYSVLD
jgi:Glycine-zipper domain